MFLFSKPCHVRHVLNMFLTFWPYFGIIFKPYVLYMVCSRKKNVYYIYKQINLAPGGTVSVQKFKYNSSWILNPWSAITSS